MLLLFKDALWKLLEVNYLTFSSILRVCVKGAHHVLREIPVKILRIWNTMLIAFTQHGDTGKSFSLFEEMEVSGFRPNSIIFLCILYACSHAGRSKRASDTLR
ncbi:hypothetical protein MLD38_028694 [Melastoma candidum]|uniref:Uncharacterized protein n=1 Tax=Melastoma candidum TaxID=119954 RepID=A0ACB9N1Q3_9MYRT|nr:hypothetical protein MLD38_028694 [Melastoma candidum]